MNDLNISGTSISNFFLFCVALLVGIFGANLHTLSLSMSSVFFGKPLYPVEYFNVAHALTAGLIVIFTFLTVIKKPTTLNVAINLPAAIMLFIVVMLTLSLVVWHDDVSKVNYFRFIAGNMLLFGGALLCCTSISRNKMIFNIWVITSLILAIFSVYMFLSGMNWSSARSAFLPAVNIRIGYFCSISIIYLTARIIFEGKNLNFFVHLLIIIVLMAGLMTARSKAAFALLIISLSLLILIKIFSMKVNYRTIYLTGFSVFSFSLIFFLINISDSYGIESGAMANFADFEKIMHSVRGRISVFYDYFQLTMKSPFTGHGIASAYQLDIRTHSVSLAFLTQIGILGFLFYLFFIFALISRGIKLVLFYLNKRLESNDASVLISIFIIVIFLMLKAEITGDVPGNRELWMFAGMLISITQVFFKGKIVNLHTQSVT